MGSDVKSKPCYTPIVIDQSASFSLFVGERSRSGNIVDSYEELTSADKFLLYLDIEDYVSSGASKLVPSKLKKVFAEMPATAKIYVFGSEAFLWDIRNFAADAGFMPEQIQLSEPVSEARRVFCTHCYHVMEDIRVTPVTCAGCGLLLLVRDHFSRSHGAYVGLNINAEDSSEVFEEEALS